MLYIWQTSLYGLLYKFREGHTTPSSPCYLCSHVVYFVEKLCRRSLYGIRFAQALVAIRIYDDVDTLSLNVYINISSCLNRFSVIVYNTWF